MMLTCSLVAPDCHAPDPPLRGCSRTVALFCACGARTLACRVETLLDTPWRARAGLQPRSAAISIQAICSPASQNCLPMDRHPG
jgi:hypothetical protein